MHSLNTEQIQQIIPHRHPFLLIDQIEDYVPGEYAVGYKGVSYHEDFFRGHFPQKAVMPGVLILEALAQTGAVAILSLPENRGKIAFFGGVQKCRFKGMVLPGDRLRLETRIIKRKGPVGVGEATASVDGKTVVINSTKSMVGHMLGAAGAVEVIVCVKSIEDQFIHQTIGTEHIDPECGLNYAVGSPVEKKIDYAMSNSLGFGGHNVSLIVKRYEE